MPKDVEAICLVENNNVFAEAKEVVTYAQPVDDT